MPALPFGASQRGARNAAASHRAAACAFYAPIIPLVAGLRRQGLSLRAIARELDRRQVRTRFVGVHRFLGAGPDGLRWGVLEYTRWSATQVRRVLARAADLHGGADPDR